MLMWTVLSIINFKMFNIFNLNKKKTQKNNHSTQDENIDDPGTSCQSSSCELIITYNWDYYQ